MDIRILLIDDEPEFLEQAKLLWERERNEVIVETTTTAEKALDKLNGEKYDLIVSDYKLPKMDGLELLKTVKEKGYNMPFILLTGKGEEETAAKALELKADHYMMKGRSLKEQYKIIMNTIFDRQI